MNLLSFTQTLIKKNDKATFIGIMRSYAKTTIQITALCHKTKINTRKPCAKIKYTMRKLEKNGLILFTRDHGGTTHRRAARPRARAPVA